MRLSIIDTEKIISHDVSWVEFNTSVGNMVIQHQHVPIIVELLSGHELLFELVTGEQKNIMITQAVAHVTRDDVKILIPVVV